MVVFPDPLRIRLKLLNVEYRQEVVVPDLQCPMKDDRDSNQCAVEVETCGPFVGRCIALDESIGDCL
jgi:hypothetical protein